jgi:hypothetical protein
MKSPLSNRSSIPSEPLAIIETLRRRYPAEACAATALAVSTLPEQGELLTLLIRCTCLDEVKLLAFAYGLRAGEEGGRVMLVNRKGTVAAQAWLFD